MFISRRVVDDKIMSFFKFFFIKIDFRTKEKNVAILSNSRFKKKQDFSFKISLLFLDCQSLFRITYTEQLKLFFFRFNYTICPQVDFECSTQ
jgi:hypothetical protein